jgi:hypothetical protein
MHPIFTYIKSNQYIQFALLAVVAVVIYMYYTKQFEGIANTPLVSANFTSPVMEEIAQMSTQQVPFTYDGAKPVFESDNLAGYTVSDLENEKLQQIADGSSPLTATDLLPKYDDSVPQSVNKLLQDQNFLISGFAQGIDTIGQNNKIAYYDIRSLPIIPKDDKVSPWMNSPYETNNFRRKLE